MKKSINVKPGSRRQEVIEEPDGSLTVYLKQRPVEGKANRELIELLSNHWHIPQRAIEIKVGAGGRKKIVEVDDDALPG